MLVHVYRVQYYNDAVCLNAKSFVSCLECNNAIELFIIIEESTLINERFCLAYRVFLLKRVSVQLKLRKVKY